MQHTTAIPEASGICVIAAHPNWRQSRVNRRLLAAARQVPGLDVVDLYSLYPDYSIRVDVEQARLERARLIVLLHPIHWYSMPPLQKLWFDEVLSFGWAYGGEGNRLHGKDLWLVASTGGTEDAYHPSGYNRYFFDAFLPPYEQTAALCGMRFLPPLVQHGAHHLSQEALEQHAQVFEEHLRGYPQWPELEECEVCIPRAVPGQDRPSLASTATTPTHNEP